MTGGMALYLTMGITIGIFCIKVLPQRKDVISPILALAMIGGWAMWWPFLSVVAVAMGIGRWLADDRLRL